MLCQYNDLSLFYERTLAKSPILGKCSVENEITLIIDNKYGLFVP
jgi:hypothetical protein